MLLLTCPNTFCPTPPLLQLVNEVTAILVSVTAILIFGEILPQSICKRHGLAIGAFLAWPVRLLMLLCSPVAWPVSRPAHPCIAASCAASAGAVCPPFSKQMCGASSTIFLLFNWLLLLGLFEVRLVHISLAP